VILTALGASAVALVLWQTEQQLPDVRTLRAQYRPAQVTRVLGRDGSLLAEMFVERRTILRVQDIPAHVKLAFIAAEDASFYEHEGLNYLGMVRALTVNLRSGRKRQGGSTITQQVVKNILLNDPSRTYSRKLKEVVLARRLEQDLAKDEILELYLNHIYLGGGRYGVEEAARYYFGKSVKELSIAEGAMLGGLTAGPELFSPRNDLAKATTRRSFVIDQLERKGFLDHARAEQARQEPLRLVPPTEAQSSLAPEVVEIARRALRERVGEDFSRGGYTVHTTIDPKLQMLARKASRENLQAFDRRTKVQGPFKAPSGKKPPAEKPFEGFPKSNEVHRAHVGVVTAVHEPSGTVEVRVGEVEGTLKLADFERYNPKQLPLGELVEAGAHLRVTFLVPPVAPQPGKSAPKVPLHLEQGPQTAMVVLDPKSREVLALVGSYDATAGGLDRATQMRRQPGSTFKAVVYSLGLHQRRITPATVFDLGTLPTVKGAAVEDGSAVTTVRLREAIARSLNPVAQKVLVDSGPAEVVKWAQQLGVSSKLGADLSLALGSYEVTPLEMAGVYGTLAAGGTYQPPQIVARIVGPDGKELPAPPRPEPVAVLKPAEAYLMTSLLTSVVREGTGARAREVGRPVAGKTGTTNQAKDTWFVGYSTDLVCAVWVGFDDPRPLGGGREAGATAALPAWIGFMKQAHSGPPTDFLRPPGLVDVRIDPASGLRAHPDQTDGINEVFLSGTEPLTVAELDAGTPEQDGGEAAPAGSAPGAEPPPPSPPPAGSANLGARSSLPAWLEKVRRRGA
jgi:penicillin-binding protein 1A